MFTTPLDSPYNPLIRYVANAKHAWSVGGLEPNGFGLFDMLGSASECCHDRYGGYYVSDPKTPIPERLHVSPVYEQ